MELAVLGRRIAEAEYDALLALGLTGAEVVADPLRDPVPAEQPAVMTARPSTSCWTPSLGSCATNSRPKTPQRLPRQGRRERVTIVRREMRLAPAERAAHRARLAAIGCADDGELAAGIRDGTVSDDKPMSLRR